MQKLVRKYDHRLRRLGPPHRELDARDVTYQLLLANLNIAWHWSEIIVGKATLEARLGPALSKIRPVITMEALLAYWFARDANLDKDLLSALERLRRDGSRLHLVTNQEHLRADHLWTTLRLKDRFDAMHYSAELGLAKPDPAFFDAVRARTGLLSAELLLIDDSPANVAAARASGWQALHWTGDTSLPALLAAAEIRLA